MEVEEVARGSCRATSLTGDPVVAKDWLCLLGKAEQWEGFAFASY